MANSADPNQILKKPTDPTNLGLHCLQRQNISGFSWTWVNATAADIIKYIFKNFSEKIIYYIFSSDLLRFPSEL